jgi:nondiscriminating aspartyl-tRNA synthetase
MSGQLGHPTDLKRRLSSELSAAMDGQTVVVAGWIHDIRILGGISFIHLRDRDGLIQITILKKKMAELAKLVEKIPRESVIMIKGTLKKSDKAKSGFEILPETIDVLSTAGVPLPMGIADKVNIELDTRLDNRFLDLRRDNIAALFKIRASMLKGVRHLLEEKGFLEVHTPKIVATATEGGTSLFSIKYFDRPAYLNQSPQLFKQILMATGFDRVYEIGPAFRAEDHDTVRHLNEFTSIDIEMSFATDEDAMNILESVVVAAFDEVLAMNGKELELIGIKVPRPKTPFPRLTHRECVDIALAAGVKAGYEEDISMEANKAIAEKYPGFYFITNWPRSIKPFYVQPNEKDPTLSKGFDLNYGEKEITSGAQRVHDINLLKENLAKQGLDAKAFEFYLKAFEFGMPPHAGWGLGAERLLMIMPQRDNIRECVLFPRDRVRLIP